MVEVNNQITTTNAKEKKLTFSQAMETDAFKKVVAGALRDPKRANRFVASVIAAVSANPSLQACKPASILSSALQGEALELSPSPALGEYALVPYKTKDKATGEIVNMAQFQIMTNGRVQLAMRTGLFEDLDSIEIREGEYKGRDKLTGKPVLEFIEDDEERETKPIIGYYAYFRLKNGFFKSVYFSKEKILQWAERYSKAFNRKLYDKYIKGEINENSPWKEQTAVTAPWYNNHDEMAKNVVLRQVLKKAPKSIEMRTVEEKEEQIENSAIAEVFTSPAEETKDEFFADATETATEQNETVEVAEVVETPKKKGRKAKAAEEKEQEEFFEEN